jgi:hypothetical protein
MRTYEDTGDVLDQARSGKPPRGLVIPPVQEVLNASIRDGQPTPEEEKIQRKKPSCLSPRNREACHVNGIALLQSIAKIGTQSTMKSGVKTLHELSPQTPPKLSKGNKRGSTDEMLHADITIITQ